MFKSFRTLFLCIGMVLGLFACTHHYDQEITLFTWNNYIDESTIQEFEEKFQTKVQIEFFANNEEGLAKIEQLMNTNQVVPYDIFMPSDYIVDYMIKKNMLAPLKKDLLPNTKDLIPFLKNPDFDRELEYSMPYSWGSVGLAYNSKNIKENIDSFDILLDENYQGRIGMLDSPRDNMILPFTLLNSSINSTDPKILEEGHQILKKQSALVKVYNGDMIADLLANEEIDLALVWSGDAVRAMKINPDISYFIPKDRVALWSDNFVILKNSPHVDIAHQFINFFYEKEIAVKNALFSGTNTPHQKALEEIPAEWRNNENLYPVLANQKFEFFQDLPESALTIYNDIYADIRA